MDHILKKNRPHSQIDADDVAAPPAKKRCIQYHCTSCDVYFSEKRALRRHCRESQSHALLVEGSQRDQHLCAECPRTFSRIHDLRRHQREVHQSQKRQATKVLHPPQELPSLQAIQEADDSGGDILHRISSSELLPDHDMARASFDLMEQRPEFSSPLPHLLIDMEPIRPSLSIGALSTDTTDTSISAISSASDPFPLTQAMDDTINEVLTITFNALYMNDSDETKVQYGASKGPVSVVIQECPVCKRQYRDGTLLMHCMSAHLDHPLRPHECTKCQFGFVSEKHLAKHLETASKTTYPSCGFDFPHRCLGHHDKETDSARHHHMDKYYMTQLCMKGKKRATTLERGPKPPSLLRRWSVEGLRRPPSITTLASSLNSKWTSPSVYGRSKITSLIRTINTSTKEIGVRASSTRQGNQLYEAVFQGQLSRVTRLLRDGCGLNVANVEARENGWNSILSLALDLHFYSEIPRQLIDAGADCDYATCPDLKCIMDTKLSRLGCGLPGRYILGVAYIMLENGVSVDQLPPWIVPPHEMEFDDPLFLNGEYTLLSAAIAHGAINLASRMIAKGADVDGRQRPDGSPSPLCTAALFERPHIAEELIANKAAVNLRGSSYGTALCCAAIKGSIETARVLMEHGANVNTLFPFYGTPLGAAMAAKKSAMVKLLQSHGATCS